MDIDNDKGEGTLQEVTCGGGWRPVLLPAMDLNTLLRSVAITRQNYDG